MWHVHLSILQNNQQINVHAQYQNENELLEIAIDNLNIWVLTR